MSPGSPAGTAPGSVLDMIRSVTAVVIGGGVRIKIDVWEPYRERFFAIFVNGIWTGQNLYAPVSGIIEANLPVTPAADVGSIWIEEVGQWDSFDSADNIPRGQAEIDEAASANRLLFLWNATYKLSTVTGDSQLTNIAITGARRGRNVANVADLPQRGRLSYSIYNSSGTYIVRWWAGDLLVAEGSVGTHPATVTCSERNNSGMEVTCTLSYTGDVKVGTAFLDVKWPKSYQIHYSTSSLSYPRSPELTKNDNGGETYEQPTAALAAGSYNYNVLPVDDEGDVEAAPSAPSDSPLTIVAPPAAPTITGITGSASGLTVAWTAGESGCTYTVYYSPINEPINRGSRSTPAPVGPTALNATSANIPAITGYAPVDRTSDYAACVTAFNSAVATANTEFTSYTDFGAALDTLETSLLAAVTTLGTALNLEFRSIKEQISRQIESVQGIVESIDSVSLGSEKQDEVGPHYSTLLQMLGAILSGNSGLYTLGAGFLPGGQPPGTGSVTGSAIDGTAGRTGVSFTESLLDAAQPLVKNGRIRVIVRATKSSIEETNDAEYEVEFDSTGAIVAARPNEAEIQSITVSGLGITVKAGVITDDASGVPATMDLYVVAVGGTIDPTTPSASASLPTALAGYQSVNVSYTVGGSGWYQIAVMARTAGSVRSEKYKTLLRYFSTDTPPAVSNLSGKVIRGIPARNKESD